MNIQSLSPSERILLAQALWDSVHREVNDCGIPAEHKAVLEQRVAAFESDRNPGENWVAVRQRITRAQR